MSYVLDASIALSWCFCDEETKTTRKLLEKLETETAHVPELWTLEVGNLLISAERKKRITFARISEFINLLNDLNIQIDRETSLKAFHEILSLAHNEKLTTYDAAYLELAMRLGIPLATKDQDLKKVAKKLGVKIFD